MCDRTQQDFQRYALDSAEEKSKRFFERCKADIIELLEELISFKP
jgi:hypothetical protein